MRGARILTGLVLLAVLPCVLLLLAATPAGAACTDTVPFFTYGSCSNWKETRLEPARPSREMFAPATQSWRATRRGTGQSARKDVSTVASYSDPSGGSGQAQLAIRCRDDTTTAHFRFAGAEMGNKGAQREIVYQVDDGEEEIIELERAKDHEVLDIDQGYRAVPFVRGLIGARKLRISAIAANGRELRAVLRLDGLGRAIAELRSACHW